MNFMNSILSGAGLMMFNLQNLRQGTNLMQNLFQPNNQPAQQSEVFKEDKTTQNQILKEIIRVDKKDSIQSIQQEQLPHNLTENKTAIQQKVEEPTIPTPQIDDATAKSILLSSMKQGGGITKTPQELLLELQQSQAQLMKLKAQQNVGQQAQQQNEQQVNNEKIENKQSNDQENEDNNEQLEDEEESSKYQDDDKQKPSDDVQDQDDDDEDVSQSESENGNKKKKLSKKSIYRKRIKKINVCGHPDKEHYAKGMCSNCYHRFGRNKRPWKCSHEKLYACGLCQNCYINRYNHKRRTDQIERQINSTQQLNDNGMQKFDQDEEENM